MSKCLIWLFGRGASVSCKLRWIVPEDWRDEDRDTQIEKIKEAIRFEMSSSKIDSSPYKSLLSELAKRTNPPWHHRFLTTNWDFLLQKEINQLGLTSTPIWLPETHVYHINGTVEEWPSVNKAKPPLRSPFLLESDFPDQRSYSEEVAQAVQYIIWRKTFVIVGMSFECEMDRAFLMALGRIGKDIQISNSCWLVLNPNNDALKRICTLLQGTFPGAKIYSIATGFNEWLNEGMPQLITAGILKNAS